MSKSKKQRKIESRATQDARKITLPKILRLVLKSMLFSLVVLGLMLLLNFIGVPAFKNLWIQVGVMLVVYFVAYPFLMREFRVRGPVQKK
jgi:uncharacterized membrane protein